MCCVSVHPPVASHSCIIWHHKNFSRFSVHSNCLILIVLLWLEVIAGTQWSTPKDSWLFHIFTQNRWVNQGMIQWRQSDGVQHYLRETAWVTVWLHRTTLPSKAEDEKGNAKDSGHRMPDQGSAAAGTEADTEPEGSSQGKQLTRQKIHLMWERQGFGCFEIPTSFLISILYSFAVVFGQ